MKNEDKRGKERNLNFFFLEQTSITDEDDGYDNGDKDARGSLCPKRKQNRQAWGKLKW